MYINKMIFSLATTITLFPPTKDSPLNNTSTPPHMLPWHLPLPATLLLLLIVALVISTVVIIIEFKAKKSAQIS